jgi:5-methylcytosine-specific restriction endonuclease McrA
MDQVIKKKPNTRQLPNGEPWNSMAWKIARGRALHSKEPYCSLCHKFVDITLPMNLPNGKRDPMAVEVDHIVPISRGGAPYEVDNLQLTHHICNRKKGTRMDSDYEGQDVVNPLPLSNSW